MGKTNEIVLEGVARTEPVWSHENHGASFYRFLLEVQRLSGQGDLLPVLVAEEDREAVRAGERLRLRGELRSFNNRSGTGRRLVLTVFARELLSPEGEDCNQLHLEGSLCKPPVFRRTPLGRSICDLMLAVPRHYGRADYLPVIAWGRLAQQCREEAVGDSLALEGRFQSRVYQKVIDGISEDRVAYEVSILRRVAADNSLW